MNEIIYVIMCCCSLLVRRLHSSSSRLHSSSSCSQTAAELLINGRWVVFEDSAFDRLLTAEVCCFVLVTQGWGKLETRPPAALGGAAAFALYLPSARCCALIGIRAVSKACGDIFFLSCTLYLLVSLLFFLACSLSLSRSLFLSLSLSLFLSLFLCLCFFVTLHVL